MTKIAPSILAADFTALGRDILKLDSAGADLVHLDIMDGSFVPNISYGPMICKAIRPLTELPFDAHLMVENPSRWFETFADLGVGMLSFHVEAERHVHRQLVRVRELGMSAGLALNPATPLESCFAALPYCDFVLLMSVDPGFGGQRFIAETVQRVEELSSYCRLNGYNVEIEVDGGVNAENAPRLIEAGADILVAGSSVFRASDMAQTISALRGE